AGASRKELRASKETIATYWSPDRQRQLEERREQASLLKPGDHAKVAAAVHMEKRLNPPADERTPLGYNRTDYEKDGPIGTNQNRHLHETNQSFSLNGTPPELQRQFFSRMLRVAERESPEKDKEDVRAEVEIYFIERGWAVPTIDVIPERPEPIA